MSARRLLLLGAALTALGLCVAMIAPLPHAAGYGHAKMQQLAGGIVLFFGWVTLGWGIHRFGRDA